MEEKDIKQVRSNLTKNLINIQKRLFKRDYLLPDYENDYQHLTELKEVLKKDVNKTRESRFRTDFIRIFASV